MTTKNKTVVPQHDIGRRLFYGETLNYISNGKRSVEDNFTATGATIAAAAPITRDATNIKNATASTGVGVRLPTAAEYAALSPTSDPYAILGATHEIYNSHASVDCTIFAGNLSTIDGTAGATGVTLTHAKRCKYTAFAVTDAGVVTWISAQLGVVSA